MNRTAAISSFRRAGRRARRGGFDVVGERPVAGMAQAKPTAAATAAPAGGGTQPLAARLPAGANAVMIVDVAKLADSPWGKQNKLREKLSAGYAERPLPVPSSTKRVAVGARINPVGLTSAWQAAVIELPAPRASNPWSRRRAGTSTRSAASRPPGAPATRSTSRRTRTRSASCGPASASRSPPGHGHGGAPALSAYVVKGLADNVADAEAVFAMDLRDAVSPAAVVYALGMGELPSLDKVETGMEKVVAALASVSGTTITVRAGAKLTRSG